LKKLDSNIGSTRCQILRLKCTKFDFRWGSMRGKKWKGEGTGKEGREKGKWREGPMTSVKLRARKVASAPLGTRAVAAGNARG